MPRTAPARGPKEPLTDSQTPRRGGDAFDQVRVHPLVRLALWAAGLTLGLYFFSAFTLVGLSLLAAGAVAAALSPLARRMPGPTWARVLLTGLAMLAAVAATVALATWVLWSPIAEQWRRWPQVQQQLDGFLATWSGRLGFEEAITVHQVRDQLLSGLTGGRAADFLSNTLNSFGVALVALALLAFGSLYLLAGSARTLQRGAERLLPGREVAVRKTGQDLEYRLRWWLLGTLISMLVSGTLQGVGYWLVGLDFALAVGVIGGLAEIVPTFGPAGVFLLAILIAATQGTTQIVGVIVVYALVQMLESYVILPLVMQRAVHIPPLITLFTVIFWGQIFGLPGLLLAVPLDILIWTLVERFYLDHHGERGPPAAPG